MSRVNYARKTTGRVCPRCSGVKSPQGVWCAACRYSPEAVFWPKVDRSGGPDSCWTWEGKRDCLGYGLCHFAGEWFAHRVAYRLAVGPVPDGLELDHLCRNTSCANPAHLEPVTGAENIRRAVLARRERPHCANGHPYTAASLYVLRGQRFCRTCGTGAARRYQERKRLGRQAVAA